MSLLALNACAIIIAFLLVSQLWSGDLLAGNNIQVVIAFMACYALAGAKAGVFASDMLAKRRRSVVVAMRAVLLASASVVLLAFFVRRARRFRAWKWLLAGRWHRCSWVAGAPFFTAGRGSATATISAVRS